INALMQRGADVSARWINGKTYLHVAAQNDDSQMVEKLLKHGLDVYLVDLDNLTALDYAIRRLHLKTVEALLKNGSLVKENETGNIWEFRDLIRRIKPNPRRSVKLAQIFDQYNVKLGASFML